MLLAAADEALLPETLDAPPGHVWSHHERAYVPPEALEAARQAARAAAAEHAAAEPQPPEQAQAQAALGALLPGIPG